MFVVAIIPVYNRKDILFSAIESVVNQTQSPDHLVVVDDGSTDGLPQEFADWEDKRSDSGCQITFIHQPNQGAAVARNAGIKAFPDADWYAFLDSDDLWPPDFLERCLKFVSHSRHIAAATLDREESHVEQKTSQIIDMSEMTADPQVWMFRYGSAFLSGSLLNGELVRELNGFPEDESFASGQDLFFLLRLAAAGPWIHVPGAPYQYRSGLGYPQLHESFSDSHHRWAIIFEKIYNEMVDMDSSRDKLFREILATRWCEAGDQHRLHYRKALSVEAYKRSNSYRLSIRALYGTIRR